MRTAIISDLHLGLTSGGDVLRDPEVRGVLLEEIAGADRVVLLGDVVELREQPLGRSLEATRSFFEDLGAAQAGHEVTIVPGNHDHRFAEPLLDELSLDGGQLGLEQTADPSPGPTATIDGWLGEAKLRIAYPGLWLREDVYLTHGHFMDVHLDLPRAECVAIATLARASSRSPAHPAGAADYERMLRPIYGFIYGAAQARPARRGRGRTSASEAAWKILSGEGGGAEPPGPLAEAALRGGFPAAVWAVNRLLRADFRADISGDAVFRSGVAAATELAAGLGLDGAHVITGHTHRAGPLPEEGEWALPGGGRLHNTGSWVFSSALHLPGRPPNSYWPGTVTWVEGSEPPRRVQLMRDRSHADLVEVAARSVG